MKILASFPSDWAAYSQHVSTRAHDAVFVFLALIVLDVVCRAELLFFVNRVIGQLFLQSVRQQEREESRCQ
jgi:hypothetical protein